ncbi:2-phospho-L-lactate guanylyltransferase [Pararhodobacter sp.]|uniref:2-phospho-L-lactate guanylyltransferase n=1 Tax=Pararhodobacter sp. TaxID=2127056 RepID=UPI002B000661|nr:2-phospho-L-lactate guanylyltransferase [Pararhodobacter sp.]
MTNVLIPVKDLSRAKGRLQGLLSPDERAGLALAMLRDVLTTLRSGDLGEIWIVAHDNSVFDLGREFGAQAIRESVSQGYNNGVAAGLQAVDARRPVMVLPADLPFLHAQDVARLSAPRAVDAPFIGIVPDRHNRGTNGLLLSRPDLIAPAFGHNSFFKHKAAAARAGVTAKVFPLNSMAVDIDCAEDLFTLARSDQPGAAVRFLQALMAQRPLVENLSMGVA